MPKGISDQRLNFIYECLSDFDNKLKMSGHELKLIDSPEELDKLSDVNCIYHSQGYLENLSIKALAETYENSTLYDIEELPMSLVDLPKVFTSFRKKIEKNNVTVKSPQREVKIEELKKVESFKIDLKSFSDAYKLESSDTYFRGGESSGLQRLDEYFSNPHLAKTYKKTRNGMIDFNDSTKFSPWLAQGCLSAKMIYSKLKEFEEKHGANESTYWIWFELLWRDFFKFTGLKHGEALKSLTGIQDHYEIKKKGDLASKAFENWKMGATGHDFIDANMRELLRFGWMSNRGRQNVASFFCHNLGLDWRWGAQWFEHQLIDYDAESNWGNWSYQAGVGNDPRNRVFNPTKQAENYDPDCQYRNKFLN